MGLTASIPCLLNLLFLLFQPSQSANTIVVDGLAEWKAPILHVGDVLIFKPKHLQNLYLFHNRRAFDLCIFDQSTLIYDGSSTHFMWRPSRLGYYYLATRDTSQRSCEEGEKKVSVRVVTADPSLGFLSLPAPAPTSGGDISSSPSNAGIFSSPSPGPSPAPLDFGPLQPNERPSPGSVPFISSSPAVPLPMGETDTATILPFSTTGSESQVVVGMASCAAVRMYLLMVAAMLSLLWTCD